jgi:predicted tellurium resistance membrane protein TerC
MVEAIIALVTLTAMEIVLGIDNIIFIAIVAGKLPHGQQNAARRTGLAVALIMRIALLFSITWILRLTVPVFTLPAIPTMTEEARALTWRDIILIAGGAFLIAKSTLEIHAKLERPDEHETAGAGKGASGFPAVVTQIVLIDMVFSLDSILTAVGMVRTNPVIPGYGELNRVWIMIAAVVISMAVMLAFAGPVSDFISKRPTLKILALSFLILIGVLLVAEGFDQHLNRGYVYFAMAFSLVVEMLNMRIRRHELIKLNKDQLPPA